MRVSPYARSLNRACLIAAIAATASSAFAVPAITNGDLEIGGTAQNTNVPNWFNYVTASSGAWWLGSWSGPLVSATGTNILGLSGDPSIVSPGPSWSYQPIGVNDTGLSTLKLQFDVGSFTDAGGQLRDMGVNIRIFQSDGRFVGADNLDIIGGLGVTQIYSTSLTSGALSAGEVVRVTRDLDISTANATGQLFIRFSNFKPGTTAGDPWTQLDNIKFLTVTPTTTDLIWSGTTIGGTWDTAVASHWNTGTKKFNIGDRPTFNNSGAVNGAGVSVVTIASPVKSGNVVINSVHDYLFQGTGTVTGNAPITLAKRGIGKVTFANEAGNTFAAGVTIEAGTVELTGFTSGSAHGINGGAIVNDGTIILNRQYADLTAINEYDPLVLSQQISGVGGLVVRNHAFLGEAGSGPKNNTFTGPVTLEAGFTYLGDVNALGSATTGTTVQAGATLGAVAEWQLGSNVVIAEPLTLNGRGVVSTYADGAEAGALFVMEGVRTFSGPIHLGSNTLINTGATADVSLTGTLSAEAGAGLEKRGGGTLRLTGATFASLNVQAGKVQQTSGTTKTASLQLAVGTELDLTTSGLAIDYDGTSPYAAILALVQSGQIKTTASSSYGIGIVDNALFASPLTAFGTGGVAVDASTVLLRGTLKGDSNLSGNVDFDDLLALARNYSATGKAWQDGDTDYNGTVDFDDLLTLARNYGQTSAGSATLALAAAGQSAEFMSDWALATSLVPEPASLSVVALGAIALGGRRRHSK